jgi:hypothetical protein
LSATEDDLQWLRNVNMRPGPDAGGSIDPTKPGPDDARAQSAIPPLRYGPAEHMPDGTEIRRLEVDALLYIKRALAPYMEAKLEAAIRTVETALAQSDALRKRSNA